MRVRCVCVVGAALLAAACESRPVAPERASWFAATLAGATVEGSISASYSGTGYFTTTRQRRPAAPPMFLLESEGMGDARGDGFELARAGDGLPAVGRYPLGPQKSGGVFQAFFTQTRGDVTYRYAATEGELQITSASSDRVAGTFSFRGTFAGTCTGSGDRVQCTVNAMDPRAPTIDVTGSFEAVPRP